MNMQTHEEENTQQLRNSEYEVWSKKHKKKDTLTSKFMQEDGIRSLLKLRLWHKKD